MAETLGQTIRGLRQKHKISQEELATRAGVSITTMSHIEQDKTNPSRSNLERIAKELQVPVVVLNLLSLDLGSLPEEKRKPLEKVYKDLRLLVSDVYDLI